MPRVRGNSSPVNQTGQKPQLHIMLHRMHEMQDIAIDVLSVSLSVQKRLIASKSRLR